MMQPSLVTSIAIHFFATIPASNIPIAKPVFSERKILSYEVQSQYYNLYQQWTFDGSIASSTDAVIQPLLTDSVIQHFNTEIIEQNIILPSLSLVRPVFIACNIKHDFLFAEKVWNYVTNKQSKNSLQEPGKLLYRHLLSIYESHPFPFTQQHWLRCLALLRQYYLSKIHNKSNFNLADTSFFNQIMRIILKKLNWNWEIKRDKITDIWNFMIQSNINPNKETSDFVMGFIKTPFKNQTIEAKFIMTQQQKEILISKYLQNPPDFIIQSFKEVMQKNIMINSHSTELILLVLDAVQQLRDLNNILHVWGYIKASKNSLVSPTHILYVKVLKAFGSVMDIGNEWLIYSTMRRLVEEWIKKYKPKFCRNSLHLNENKELMDVPVCAVFTEAMKIIIKVSDNRKSWSIKSSEIRAFSKTMKELNIVPDSEARDVMKLIQVSK